MRDMIPEETEEPSAPELLPDMTEEKESSSEPWRSLLLTLLQIAACAVLIGGAFVVKLIGGNVCGTVSTWFHDRYQDTILIDSLPMPELPRLSGGVEESSLYAFEEGAPSQTSQEQEPSER